MTIPTNVTPSDARLKGPQSHEASEAEVARLANGLLEDRRFHGVKVGRFGLGEKKPFFHLHYRGCNLRRVIPRDTFAGMITALSTWIDRQPGALADALREVDARLPCVACNDDVRFCVSCGGKGHDRKHRDRASPRPLLSHESSVGGYSMSDGCIVWGKRSKAEILHESPPCAGFTTPTANRGNVSVVIFTDDCSIGCRVSDAIVAAGYGKVRVSGLPNDNLNIKEGEGTECFTDEIEGLICEIANIPRGAMARITGGAGAKSMFINLRSSALEIARRGHAGDP